MVWPQRLQFDFTKPGDQQRQPERYGELFRYDHHQRMHQPGRLTWSYRKPHPLRAHRIRNAKPLRRTNDHAYIGALGRIFV